MKKKRTRGKTRKRNLSPGAKRFRKLLKDKGLTYRELADKTNVSLNIVSRLSEGKIMQIRKDNRIRIFMFLETHWGTIYKEEFKYWKRETEREIEIERNSKK